MEASKILFCSLDFPWARERIFSKYIDNLSTRPQKASPSLFQVINMHLLSSIVQSNTGFVKLSIQQIFHDIRNIP
jgi:hypothetical protein